MDSSVNNSDQPSFVPEDFKQIRIDYEEEYGVLHFAMRPSPRPVMTVPMLEEIYRFTHEPRYGLQGLRQVNGQSQKVNYLVLSSDIPGVFNLGGDLATFQKAIREQDLETLKYIGRISVEAAFQIYQMNKPVTTISLVKGQAMGGGFEGALSTHVFIAERSSKMGLPETLFNLFPGQGALSYLSRKVGMALAEKMVFSGKIYTAAELYDMGVVDVLAEDGEGDQVLKQWIKKNSRNSNAFQATIRAKQRVQPLLLDELVDISDIWAEAALRLTERELKIMDRLVRAQSNKVSNIAASGVVAPQKSSVEEPEQCFVQPGFEPTPAYA